jgi:thiamine-monophosphate kinase
MNEFALIDRYFRRAPRAAEVLLGIGDDGAVVRPLPGHDWVVTVDMLVEGRHFLPGTDAERLGHKTLAVNLSDLAAMGARPRYALLAGALPDASPVWLEAFARGLFALAEAHGVDLIGGDTTRGPRNLCLTLFGDVPEGEAITRAGARDGDDVWVSGTLGDAMLALAALQGRTALGAEALERLRVRLEMPVPRVALGMALRGVASAAIDVSDGLLGDLGHICERSSAAARGPLGAVIDLALVPRGVALDVKLAADERRAALQWLLAGGDDYELCFTAPVDRRVAVERAGAETAVAVTRIGQLDNSGAIDVRDERGALLSGDELPASFDHFAC